MGKINVLSFAVANLIAAGEVVDRPASAIKELLENAIDAGADRVTVEIQNGGVTFMRVSDNGCGIEPDDLPVAVRRHATSKIKDAEDLAKILTLGFRGEALAAIASVSNMRIISKTESAEMGAMIEVECGNILGVTERGCSKGTTVIVENLFENVPARRKFLKRDATEAMAVTANVEKIALSHPEVAIRLICDGNVKLETAGDGKLSSTIYSVFGKDFAKRMIEVDSEIDGIRVKGFIGRSDNVKGNRNYQNFFLNGRYVKSRTASAAIEQAFVSYIPPEKYPVCVLDISIHPTAVDVNVHPAKLEVKFSNEKAVFEAVYYTVRSALESNKDRPDFDLARVPTAPQNQIKKQQVTVKSPTVRVSDLKIPIEDAIRGESAEKRQLSIEGIGYGKPENKKEEIKSAFATMSASEYAKKYTSGPSFTASYRPKEEAKLASPAPDIKCEERVEIKAEKVVAPEPIPEPPVTEEIAPTPEPVPEVPIIPFSYRIVGEIFNCYVVVEIGEKVLLVDKHAAHERINFERLKAAMKATEPSSQLLMIPLDVMLTSDEVHILDEYRGEIESLGFAFTTARNTVSVSAIPEGISTDAVTDMLVTMADRLKSGTGSASITRDIVFEKALYQASCKASIKGGREYPPEYIEWLIAKLMEIPDITVCPHGRPVAMELSKANIDRQFLRT
ncbi:MAG: DNA mismatch repair endonuclease MutL [Clostridia bacterium]|nr:DNA mismatch repair endonuclease MutL [Clostridia bacterium]